MTRDEVRRIARIENARRWAASRLVRFEARVSPEPNTGCWLWTGPVNRRGYGKTTVSNRTVAAHRVAYELWLGVSPGANCVCHRCDNPTCVNPAHLFIGSHADNVRDKIAKGRQTRGADVTGGRLMPEDVSVIRSLHQGKRGDGPKLAARFGVSRTTISRISRGLTWCQNEPPR